MQQIHVIDSHTGGEPTRVVISGGPDLGNGPLNERRDRFREQFDWFRRSVVLEPRGYEAMVAGLLVEPHDPDCSAGIIFFNNVGFLGMCGHGTIGLVATLAHLGRIQPGVNRIATPVGVVTTEHHQGGGGVSVRNVAAYRHLKCVAVDVDGEAVIGDVAWGGNWFFLCNSPAVEVVPENLSLLTDLTLRIRSALQHQGITGADGAEIDHVELFGPERNFVMCPGGQYDRSPCGTGLSAKLACLYEDGKLRPGEVWRQQSITGSWFEGSVEIEEGRIIPTITGSAFITAEATLLLDPSDPFVHGIDV